MDSRLNLRRMIHLDEVETLLSSLMETVDRQGREIDDLKSLCRSFLSAQTAHEKFQTLELSVDDLSSALTHVQLAATAQLNDNRTLSAGELSAHNYEQIEVLKHSLLDLVHRDEMQSAIEMVAEKETNDIKSIREWATPLDVASALQKSLTDTSHRITSIEGAVAVKLDRSELSHIEALARRLQTYEDFKHHTQDTLTALQKSLQEAHQLLNEHTTTISTVNEFAQQALKELKKFAPKTETRALAKQVEGILDNLKLYALETSLPPLQERMNGLEHIAREAHNRCTLLDQDVKTTVQQLTNKAALSDVRACVLRTHYDEAVNALGNAIDQKAPVVEVAQCTDRVQVLESSLAAQCKQLAVAVRFVEWFTTRGENYEHNMKTIDKHLKGLGQASHPGFSETQPYSGQIKYTSILRPSNSSTSSATEGFSEGVL